MEQRKAGDRVVAFDLLNIAACMAVVMLHVNGAIWTFSYGRYWWTSLIGETVFYWAVPVFFMLSGANLMDYRKRYSTRTFLKKRFEKTLIPFLFWSVISVLWSNALGSCDVHGVRQWIDAILNSRGMGIYWFFIPLFALYLALPALSLIPEQHRKNIFGGMIVYSFATASVLPMVFQALGIPYNYSMQNPLNGGSNVMWLLLGYWITHYPIGKRTRMASYGLGVLALLLRYFGTLVLSYRDGGVNLFFSGYERFPSVLLAVAVFIWFYYHDWSFITEKQQRLLVKLSGASFGVYLIHFYLLQVFTVILGVDMRSIWWRVLGTPVLYPLSVALVLLGKRLPVVKKILP